MKNPSSSITSMTATQHRLRTLLTPLIAMCLAISLLTPSVRGAQGAASYLDFDDANPGFGTPVDTSENTANWSTSAAGTVGAVIRPSGTQITIGAAATDFAGPTPFNFAINLSGGGNLQGVVINS